MKIWYPCIIQKDGDHKYFVTFPDFPETLTEGDAQEEALFNASEALTSTLEGRAEEDMEIPLPAQSASGMMIYPSSRVQAALLVRFGRKGRKKADIARSLGTSWPVVSNMEDLRHWTTLSQLDKTAAILGKKLVVSFEDNSIQ
ncbi:MAG: type II toxin-antitoxin system HicB family antitoxin [Alphaproteobacteria bacterium]|nr:type II toxin-antitoxin system HicB family antitoxin [Alphaproteobacteria bacterium]